MDKYGIALGPEERVKVSKAILLTKPTVTYNTERTKTREPLKSAHRLDM